MLGYLKKEYDETGKDLPQDKVLNYCFWKSITEYGKTEKDAFCKRQKTILCLKLKNIIKVKHLKLNNQRYNNLI